VLRKTYEIQGMAEICIILLKTRHIAYGSINSIDDECMQINERSRISMEPRVPQSADLARTTLSPPNQPTQSSYPHWPQEASPTP
jgi:hypothetical protein